MFHPNLLWIMVPWVWPNLTYIMSALNSPALLSAKISASKILNVCDCRNPVSHLSSAPELQRSKPACRFCRTIPPQQRKLIEHTTISHKSVQIHYDIILNLLRLSVGIMHVWKHTHLLIVWFTGRFIFLFESLLLCLTRAEKVQKQASVGGRTKTDFLSRCLSLPSLHPFIHTVCQTSY